MTFRSSATARWLMRSIVVTICVGVGGGLSGLVVSLALRGIEHLAFGYSDGSFLDGVVHSAPWRRVFALVLAGIIGGFGWWAVRRWLSAIVSVEQSVAGARMPAVTTVLNAGLQIVIVGLGASIGRELAPREISAMIAGWIADKSGVTARERRVLIACGAGAGLAAVYNVPLGGAIFAVEILLAELSIATVVPAIMTSAIATIVAWIAVPMEPLYVVPSVVSTPSLLVWAALAGPVIGVLAVGFVRGTKFAERVRPRSWAILFVMPIGFAAVGFASIALPAILGNGKALGQLAFTASESIGVIVVLGVAKAVATTATVGSGAAGGTLTPSLAIGACLGAVLGGVWTTFWPGTSIAAFTLVGAAAFLGTSMRAPITAVVLVVEFTHAGVTLMVPILLAVAGAVAVGRLISRTRVAEVP